jgi:hypothetical protein
MQYGHINHVRYLPWFNLPNSKMMKYITFFTSADIFHPLDTGIFEVKFVDFKDFK